MVLAPAQRCIVAGALALIACQPGALTTPPVVPLPATATGFPVFLLPEPAIGKIEDNEARPLAITFQHDVRDTLEEAGFKLVATQEAAAGVVVRISVEKVTSIHADVFIHGAQACGVRIDVQRAGTTLASAEPEVPCLSTSAYYGCSRKTPRSPSSITWSPSRRSSRP